MSQDNVELVNRDPQSYEAPTLTVLGSVEELTLVETTDARPGSAPKQ